MKEVRYNILINKTSSQFSERGFECILAIILAIGVLTLLMFVPIAGIAIGIFAACFLCIGIKKYLISIVRNNFTPVETIFSSFKISIRAFCLKVATMLISALWALIFIIPGVVSLLNYSMASFIMADNENLSSLECMVKSKKLVNGFKGEIFILYLSYFFVTVVAFCILSALGIVIKNFTNLPLWVPIVGMLAIFLFILLIFIIPYFELLFANTYILLLQNQENLDKDKSKEQAKTTTRNAGGTNKAATSRSITKTTVTTKKQNII